MALSLAMKTALHHLVTTRDAASDARATRAAPATTVEVAGDRRRKAVFSDGTVDRFNTTISPAGWKLDAFRKNPILLFDHDASGLPLGRVVELSVAGDALVGTVEFFDDSINPDASRRMKALDQGVGGFSIRFNGITAKAVYNPAREAGDERDLFFPPLDYVEQELVEVSLVNVGGNANAVAARAFTPGEAARIDALRRAAKQNTRSSHQEKRAMTLEELLAALAAETDATKKAELKAQLKTLLNAESTPDNGAQGGSNGTQQAAPAPAPAAGAEPGRSVPDAAKAERERIGTIRAMVKKAKLDDARAEKFITDGVTVEAARAVIFEEMVGSQTPSNNQHSGAITGGETDGEKFARGVTAALLRRVDGGQLVRQAQEKKLPGFEKLDDGGEFRGLSMVEICRRALHRQGVRVEGMSRMEVVGKAFRDANGMQGTSDFPVLLENTIGKVLRASYAVTPDTWSKFCKTETVPDFRPSPRYMSDSLSVLDAKNEHGEFKNKALPDGSKLLISTGTKGNIIAITREAIINDDLGALTDLATKAGRAARLSVEVDVYALLVAGHTANLADGNPFFHASRSNIGTAAALSVAAIDADRVTLGSMKDKSGNEYLDLRPTVLVLPIGLGAQARVINTSANNPDATKNVQQPNPVSGLFRDIVDTARLTGTRRYLFTDPSVCPALLVAFLEDQGEGPSIETQNGWRVDGAELRVRYDFRAQWFDPKGAITNAGQ